MHKYFVLLTLTIVSITISAQTYDKDFFAACENELTKVKDYLKKGIDINQKDNDGNTPLMVASRPFNSDMIKLLVESGADLNQINKDGKTALTLLYTRPWASNDFHREKDIWDTYAYLKSKGAREQDYVDFVARNLSGKDSVLQIKVLQIKKDVANFYKIHKVGKRKQFSEKDSTKDENGNYSTSKANYQASYDGSGNLEFFECKHEEVMEWSDNGMQTSGTQQYFFNAEGLYFYFEEVTRGTNQPLEQFRVYIDKGNEVITAYKCFDNFYNAMPEELKDINRFVNIKCADLDKPAIKKILEEFDRIYANVKNKLK